MHPGEPGRRREPDVPRSIKQVAVGVGVAAGIALGAAGIAGAAGSSNSTTGSTATAPSATTAIPEHGTAAHENDEKAVTGTAATQAQAAAVKAVGSGTAGAVTSDFRGGGYETTVTKADGSTVEVHLDSSFNVMQGRGDHGTAAHENSEKAVTGTAATQAQAAAVKSVGSGKAGAVTSDRDGNGYETTVTKADGSTVEVHLDSSFNVMQGHDGHGDGPGGTSSVG
jgi:DNA uptake protein ComE-like DNA-binding protein